MTDSWSVPKPLGYIAGIAAALVSIGGAWKMLGSPTPAMQAWVHEYVADDSLTLLHVRRQLCAAELFQWEANAAMDSNAQEQSLRRLNVERLKAEIAAIDRQIAARSR